MKKAWLIVLCLVSAPAFADLTITGPQAKAIYESLTGPEVIADAGAGSAFASGRDVTCRKVNADMGNETDEVDSEDPRRYSCELFMSVDKNGLIEVMQREWH